MIPNQNIYLDNAATTPLDPEVLEVMTRSYRTLFGNPSSIHSHGRKAKAALEKARRQVAQIIHASPGEIYFTSGGTEANNTALLGAVRDLDVQNIITTRLEHPSVLNMLNYIQSQYPSVGIHWAETDALGAPSYSHLEDLLHQYGEGKTLVSMMHANNETGTLTDIHRIGELCDSYGAFFHCDTVQTMGFYPIDVSKDKIHFSGASAHKFYGPKGIGFLYMSNASIVHPLMYGGGQERGMRSSTENVAGAMALAFALQKMERERERRRAHITALRQHLIRSLRRHLPSCRILHDDTTNCHYKIANIALPPTSKAELAVINLDIAGISVSGGSACSSGVEKVSHVIDILDPEEERKHIRISFSHHNTTDEIDRFIEEISRVL